MIRLPPISTLVPYPTRFRSLARNGEEMTRIAFVAQLPKEVSPGQRFRMEQYEPLLQKNGFTVETFSFLDRSTYQILYKKGDRKSTRLNSSHANISYAVFCLK